jgi:hypothetical protein
VRFPRPSHLLAALFALAAAAVWFDVAVSWTCGAPPRAWGVIALSPMRLASFVALASALSSAAWLCARGWPERPGARSALALTAIFALFLGNGRYIGSNDIGATRLLPFVLGREARACFEGSSQVGLDPNALPYSFVHAASHIVSRYPVATAILALPAYLPALLGSYDSTRERVHELERIAAGALALISVWIMLSIARRWLDERQAWAATLVYAFGTSVSTIVSKALWQHTGGAFGFSLALAGLLLASRRWSQILLLGLGLGCAVAARSTNALPATLLLMAALFAHGPRSVTLSAAVAALPVCATLLYSAYYFGSPFGNGYGHEAIDGWSSPWLSGFAGLLISPGRGLLIYSPCLAFAAVALLCENGQLLDRRVARLILLSIVSLIALMAKWWCWWGGGSPGERMTSDVVPLWGVGLVLAFRHFSQTRLRPVWLASCIYACALQTLIVFVPPGALATELFTRVLRGPWDLRAFAPVAYLLSLLN